MKKYKVTNKETAQTHDNNGNGFTVNSALDLYDSLGGTSKGFAVKPL